MGIFTMIKVGLVLMVLLGVGGSLGYFLWEYHHRAEVIAEQKIEIANQKLQIDVLQKKAAAEAEFQGKKTTARKVYSDAEKQIDSTDLSQPSNVIPLFDKYRVRPNGAVQPAADGKGGGAKSSTGRSAPAGSN